MNRSQLKADAKAAMSMTSPHPVLVTIVYLIMISIVQAVLSSVSGVVTLIENQLSDPEIAGIFALITLLPMFLISLAVSLIISILQIGYIGYSLRVINRHPAAIGNLFGYFRFFLKIWGLHLVMNLFIFLWSMLFIIPGIIASYRYSQAFYVLAENPDKGILECLEESKRLMMGYKLEKFVLDLSFILWELLSIVTCGIAAIYVTPYMQITYAAFYNTLKYGCSSYQQYRTQQSTAYHYDDYGCQQENTSTGNPYNNDFQ